VSTVICFCFIISEIGRTSFQGLKSYRKLTLDEQLKIQKIQKKKDVHTEMSRQQSKPVRGSYNKGFNAKRGARRSYNKGFDSESEVVNYKVKSKYR